MHCLYAMMAFPWTMACSRLQAVSEGDTESKGKGGYPPDSWQLEYNARLMAAAVLLQLQERCVRAPCGCLVICWSITVIMQLISR